MDGDSPEINQMQVYIHEESFPEFFECALTKIEATF